MTSILDFTLNYGWTINTKNACFGPNSHKINKLSYSEPPIKKIIGSIFILIAIMFLVYVKVNFAAILVFFFQIYSSVTFSPNPLCYHKYVIVSSTCLAVYL